MELKYSSRPTYFRCNTKLFGIVNSQRL